jgi:Cu/Ag efflux protein CusF
MSGSRFIFAVSCLTLLAACGDGGKSQPAGRAPDVYHARGVVEQLPQAEGPYKALYIRHAAIPDYRDDTGAVVGMGSMTMPFPLAKGVAIDGLAPGDPVEFTFVVTWQPKSGYEVSEIRELPAGTVVDFAAP